MDNQHEKIIGYRDLTQAEIDLMNRIKSEGVMLEELIAKVRNTPDTAHHWTDMAQTILQFGLMALTRAVTRPTTF